MAGSGLEHGAAAGEQRISRRAVLRQGGLLVGGVGIVSLVAGCAREGTGGWTFPPTSSAVPSPVAALQPSPSPVASQVGTVAAASAGASGAAGTAAPDASGAARDPSPAAFVIPPPYRPASGSPVDFRLDSFDGPGQTIRIAADRAYASMNFSGQVPAPTLRITEGDTVRFTLTNRGAMPHSIDFHAAQTAWSRNYQTVAVGESLSFEWTAEYPGVFLYHCGAPPVIMHIADGMFGGIIVDPKEGRPPAREYIVVQSEFYGTGGDYQAMLDRPPDVVAFNGQAFRYKTAPLEATAGELVRIFVVNAGPNMVSAFHVIGALFSSYEPEGHPANAQGMHQTITVPPGDGALVELRFAEPGTYPFVTHKFNDAEKGAVGLFQVR